MDAISSRDRTWRGLIGYLIVGIVAAILGGIIALYLWSGVIPQGQARPLPQQLEEEGPPSSTPAGLPSLPPGLSGQPVVAIAQQVGPAVVGVTKLAGRDFFNKPVTSTASGVVIDRKNGYIVTNFHVIENAQEIRVSVDKDKTYPAKLVGGDRQTDLAVVQIKAPDLTEARLGDSTRLQVGEMAVAIGNPLGREFARSVTVGVISALDREITVGEGAEQVTLRVLQTDAAINPGNSGGALVNDQGEVVGINSSKIARADVEGMGFAIPISDGRPVIQQLIKQGYVERPFIGIFNFDEITPDLARYFQVQEGIYVGGVVPSSPAAQAGLQREDIILELGNQSIKTLTDLQRFLTRHQVGDRIQVVVDRQGRRVTLELTLAASSR